MVGDRHSAGSLGGGCAPGVDLLVLDDAPLELAGRVAASGRLLFEDDRPARIDWQAQTRIVYFDEEWRQEWITEAFLEAHARAAWVAGQPNG